MSVFLVHITSWGSKGPGVNLQEMNESQCNALWSHVCVYMCACAWCLLHCDSTLKLMLCERCGLCACRFLCWRVRLIDRSPLSPSLWKILFIPCFSVMIYTTPPATTHWSEKQLVWLYCPAGMLIFEFKCQRDTENTDKKDADEL